MNANSEPAEVIHLNQGTIMIVTSHLPDADQSPPKLFSKFDQFPACLPRGKFPNLLLPCSCDWVPLRSFLAVVSDLSLLLRSARMTHLCSLE